MSTDATISPLTRATKRYIESLDRLTKRVLTELGAGIGAEITSTKAIRKQIRVAAHIDKDGDPAAAMQEVEMAWQFMQAKVDALRALGVDILNPVDEEIGKVVKPHEDAILATIGATPVTGGLKIEDILDQASPNGNGGTPIENIPMPPEMTGGPVG